MKLTDWLRLQVGRLEHEIRQSEVFERQAAPTARELEELRKKVVIRAFLEQELQRREGNGTAEIPIELVLLREHSADLATTH